MKGSNEQGACVGLELRDLVRSPGGEVGGVAQTAEKRGRLPQAGRSEVRSPALQRLPEQPSPGNPGSGRAVAERQLGTAQIDLSNTPSPSDQYT